MTHKVKVPAGCGYIVHVWRTCKDNPGVSIGEPDVKRLERAGLADWTDRGWLTTDRMLDRLRGSLERRINRNDVRRGRKAGPDYQSALRRDADKANRHAAQGLVVRSFETMEAQQRCSHCLDTE